MSLPVCPMCGQAIEKGEPTQTLPGSGKTVHLACFRGQ